MSDPEFKVGDVVRVVCRSDGMFYDWGEDYEAAVRGDNLHSIEAVDTVKCDDDILYCYQLR